MSRKLDKLIEAIFFGSNALNEDLGSRAVAPGTDDFAIDRTLGNASFKVASAKDKLMALEPELPGALNPSPEASMQLTDKAPPVDSEDYFPQTPTTLASAVQELALGLDPDQIRSAYRQIKDILNLRMMESLLREQEEEQTAAQRARELSRQRLRRRTQRDPDDPDAGIFEPGAAERAADALAGLEASERIRKAQEKREKLSFKKKKGRKAGMTTLYDVESAKIDRENQRAQGGLGLALAELAELFGISTSMAKKYEGEVFKRLSAIADVREMTSEDVIAARRRAFGAFLPAYFDFLESTLDPEEFASFKEDVLLNRSEFRESSDIFQHFYATVLRDAFREHYKPKVEELKEELRSIGIPENKLATAVTLVTYENVPAAVEKFGRGLAKVMGAEKADDVITKFEKNKPAFKSIITDKSFNIHKAGAERAEGMDKSKILKMITKDKTADELLYDYENAPAISDAFKKVERMSLDN